MVLYEPSKPKKCKLSEKDCEYLIKILKDAGYKFRKSNLYKEVRNDKSN